MHTHTPDLPWPSNGGKRARGEHRSHHTLAIWTLSLPSSCTRASPHLATATPDEVQHSRVGWGGGTLCPPIGPFYQVCDDIKLAAPLLKRYHPPHTTTTPAPNRQRGRQGWGAAAVGCLVAIAVFVVVKGVRNPACRAERAMSPRCGRYAVNMFISSRVFSSDTQAPQFAGGTGSGWYVRAKALSAISPSIFHHKQYQLITLPLSNPSKEKGGSLQWPNLFFLSSMTSSL